MACWGLCLLPQGIPFYTRFGFKEKEHSAVSWAPALAHTHRPAAGSGGVRHLVVLGWGPRTWLYLRSLWCPGETGPEVSAWELKPMLCVSRGISGGFLSLILGLAALPFLAWPKLPSSPCIPTPVWVLHGKHASPLNLGIVG